MELRKILMIGLIVVLLFIASAAPISINVWAGGSTTDTIVITLNPIGNVSIEVAPAAWAIGNMWAVSKATSGANHYTIYNNGTVDMQTVIQKTSTDQDIAIDEAGIWPGADNQYTIMVRADSNCENKGFNVRGAAGNNSLDTDIDPNQSDTFGLQLRLSNITNDWASQTITITLTGWVAA